MIKIDNNDVEKKASIIRRYPIEIVLLLLILLSGFLLREQSKMKSENFHLQNEFNEFLKMENKSSIKAIQENTDAIKRNNEVIQEFKSLHRPGNFSGGN